MVIRRERLALLLVALILVGLPLAALGYQFVARPALSPSRVIDIRAAAPENGGFQPDTIRVTAGETVTLRFFAVDVTHGVAIAPGLGIDLGDIDPGQMKEVTLTFDEAGTYTFYCNTWCSEDHWRMRGVAEVVDPANPGAVQTAEADPVIERLIAEGADIDANVKAAQMEGMQPSEVVELSVAPSAERGGTLLTQVNMPEELESLDWQRTHTPAQAVEVLAGANPDLTEQDLLDVVAYLWLAEARSETIAAAQTIYDRNCAACHGQFGGADGPMAETTAEDPAGFGDTAYMWGMRSDVLYAKIRRGGMGTDMPNFGTLFTPDETWTLVEYLWRLALAED